MFVLSSVSLLLSLSSALSLSTTFIPTTMPASLYYTQTSCGAANYICAHAAGLIQSGAVVGHEVDISPKKLILATGADFTAVNPKGNVPCVVTEKGTLLNEGPATMQFIGDLAPNSGLVPAAGTDERYTYINRLNLVSELHQSIGPIFGGDKSDKVVAKFNGKCASLLKHELNGTTQYLTGDKVCGADYYLYIVLSWTFFLGVDLPKGLADYYTKIDGLSTVKDAKAAMAAAGPK